MSILDSAEWLRQLKNYSGSGAWLDEANSHDAQFGSTSGADTNDPLYKSLDAGQYVYLPGGTGNFLSAPDTAALSITGDVDLRARVALDDWTPGTTMDILSKYTTTGSQRSYRMAINTNGTIGFGWSTDGAGSTTFASSVAPSVSDGDTIWLRVTFDVDDGASGSVITYYTAPGTIVAPVAADFTQLGTTDTASNTSIFDSTAVVSVFGLNSGTANVAVGDCYRAQIYSGIDGTLEFDAAIADATEPYATFAERSSNAATVTFNRSSSGLMSTVIDRPWGLLTTNDYWEIPDDGNLDFSGSEDLTVMVMFRTNTVASGSDVLLAKKDDLTTAAGYALVRNAANGQGIIADGTADDDDTVTTVAVHTLHTLTMVRNTVDDDIEVFLDGVASGSATADSTTSTLANALVQRLGATAGATPANFFEGVIGADAGWRSALTAAQVLEAHQRLTQLPAFPPFHRRQNTLVRM